jgi:Tol biopolymer transport system component
MWTLIFNILFLTIVQPAISMEPLLGNIKQLTSPRQGFEKAGEAYFSPDSQTIIFQGIAEGEEDYQIYTMDLVSKKITQISQEAGACTCSYFRPDGQKIIFAASPEKSLKPAQGHYKWDFTPFMNIYEANPDGSEQVALTQGAAYHAECAYSPDGSQIVYASNQDGSMNIYVMKSDGSDVRQLTHTSHCYNGGPFFSPDGSKIVFRADRDTPDSLQIYMMDRDGKNLEQLTDNDAVNWAPFWHPSGKAIAYTTSLQGHSNYHVYLLNIATREQVQVTFDSSFNGLPTFDREGTRLLWTSKRGEDKSSQIFIADFWMPPEWLENGIKPKEDL